MLHPVCTSDEVRELDRRTIHEVGVPSLALMETAGRACTEAILEHFPEVRRRGACIYAGRGNNGGDGWVIARLLHRQGVPVRVVVQEGRSSPDCAVMRGAAEALGVSVGEPEGWLQVDALLGTGLQSDLRPPVTELLARFDPGQPIMAVDLPTGLCGNTGHVYGLCLPAALTVTFGAARLGQLLRSDLVGHLVVADIGLVDGPVSACVPDGQAISELIGPWDSDVHKGQRGRLGVYAGSRGMEGAGVLTCLAALRAGCGLVTLHSDRVPRGLPVEVMHTTETLHERYDAVAVGPGLGVDPEALRLWRELALPGVFDADGLNSLGPRPESSRHPRAITPHVGEAARLLGWKSQEVVERRLEASRALEGIAPSLLKGPNTLVGARSFNPTGGPMLATAGSGDVLTGIVGAFLARGLASFEALQAGAFVHGLAGELAGDGCIASDIAQAIPKALGCLPERLDVLDWRPLCA